MDALTSLRHDHALLRKKLALLESALQVAPEARLVLREMCFSLLRLLQDHMQREAPLLQRYGQGVLSGQVPTEAADHSSEQHLLRGVSELLLSGMRASVPMVVLRLSQAIDQLEAQIGEQERRIFPFLEETEHPPGDETMTISGAMSVNEILQRYPQTEGVFEQLQINRLREGYESVDELAWRHGVDASQVLERLRHLVHSP